MSAEVRSLKSEIRGQVRAKVRTMAAAERRAASDAACRRLEAVPEWLSARCVLMFYPLPDELDISILLQVALALGKELALPRFEPASGSYLSAAVRSLETDLKPGQFGTCEPAPGCQSVPLNRLDFALVPGVAFTLDGRRLGRGKGFYDRLLAGIRGLKCGVAFDQQLVDAIPTEPHDCRVDCILTPSLWHCVGPGAAME